MGIKEKMMKGMMDGMSAEEKKGMMDKMMDNFFSNMTGEEKQSLMKDMMPKMMKNMMGGMDGSESNPMRDMMGMIMGGKSGKNNGFNPMDMCRSMMSGMNKASELASFATPEVRGLFEEWVVQIEDEILEYIKGKDSVDPDEIAAHFKLSKESVHYFLAKLSQKNKISIKAENLKE